MKKIILSVTMMVVFSVMVIAAKAPKYVFYFIGDGMGLSPVFCADAYYRSLPGNTSPLLMLQFPVVSYATSFSASHTITDSAAAGTALACGKKTSNGMLGTAADTTDLRSIALDLQEKGYGIAIATSVAPDDATPTAFYAHVANRGMFYEITQDMAKSNYAMFAGGKLRGRAPEGSHSVKEVLTEAGYDIVEGPQQWNEKKHGEKVVLLNAPYYADHIGYAVDHTQGNLTLPFITKACLSHMQTVSPDRFFIMVEGGLIDHALHPNDAGTAVHEILDFNESLRVAYEFYLQHPDETLILVTADHNTGGLVAGANGASYNLKFSNITQQHISLQHMQHECKEMMQQGDTLSWDSIKGFLQEQLGLFTSIPVSEQEENKLQQAYENTFINQSAKEKQTLYVSINQFAEQVFRLLDRKFGVGWTTYSHTADFVPVYAIGVGCQQFQGYQDNTDLPRKLREICGIK